MLDDKDAFGTPPLEKLYEMVEWTKKAISFVRTVDSPVRSQYKIALNFYYQCIKGFLKRNAVALDEEIAVWQDALQRGRENARR